jgi:hypothetical protein
MKAAAEWAPPNLAVLENAYYSMEEEVSLTNSVLHLLPKLPVASLYGILESTSIRSRVVR